MKRIWLIGEIIYFLAVATAVTGWMEKICTVTGCGLKDPDIDFWQKKRYFF
jgi:hypothetical protein